MADHVDGNMQSQYNNLHRKYSTDKFRNKLRQKFISTLQLARRKSVDARRFSNSSDRDVNQKVNTVQNLREILLDNKELRDRISPDEMDDIFKEVEEEVGWRFNEEVNLYEAEIQAIIDSLLYNCLICDQSSVSIICESCGNEHFSDSL